MKTLKGIIIIFLILSLVYFLTVSYANKIEKIDKGEMTQVSEFYMK